MRFAKVDMRNFNDRSKATQKSYLNFAEKRRIYYRIDENNGGQEDEGKDKAQG